MKSFLRDVCLFVAFPVVLLTTIEVVLPPTFFTFRTWEALRSRKLCFIGPFYPDVECFVVEVGDLAHHTGYAVKKEVRWKTDNLGFRNECYVPEPDIVIVGDSNIAGSSLSQEETLGFLLNRYTGRSVYSIAPADMNTFVGMMNTGIIRPPSVVVFSRLERFIPTLPAIDSDSRIRFVQSRMNPFVQLCAVPVDKVMRMNSLRYLKSRMKNSSGFGIQSVVDDRMFFYQGTNAVIEAGSNTFDHIMERMAAYRSYCSSIGSAFVFLPIPNKETVLWELAGLESEPDFMNELTEKMRNSGITVIDPTPVLNDLKNRGTLPFHYDDTHWNGCGVDALAREMAQRALFRGKGDCCMELQSRE